VPCSSMVPRRFPAGEAAFTEALDDVAQTHQDRIALEVTFGAALVHTGTHAHASEGKACLSVGGCWDSLSDKSLPASGVDWMPFRWWAYAVNVYAD
jgi:hypothetical protein